MALNFRLVVFRNGTALESELSVIPEQIAVTVDHLPGARSSVTVDLPPGDLEEITIDPADEWDVVLRHVAPISEREPDQVLSSECVAVAAEYAMAVTDGPNGVEVTRRRRITLRDAHAFYRDRAPSEEIEHAESDTRAELAFIAHESGLADATTTLPAIRGDFTYTREGGFWGPLLGYFAPWSPVDYIDPTSHALRIIDPTEIDDETPNSGAVLGRDDYSSISVSVNARERVSQAKVTYLTFGGGGASPTPVTFRTETSGPRREDDGTETTTIRKVGFLYEDPDDPTIITREVPIGEAVIRVNADGTPLSRTETTHRWERDYTLLAETVRVTDQLVDLPDEGRVYREIERETEESRWERDPEKSTRYLLRETTRTVRGLYVYQYASDAFDPAEREALERASATPLRVASHSGTVDAGGTSSQRTGEGVISIWQELFTPGESGIVTIVGTLTDSLREKEIDSWERFQIGETAVETQGRPKSFYVPETAPAGQKIALSIDATKIGPALGRELAERRIAETAPIVRAEPVLTRPDHTACRLGSIVSLDTDAPGGYSGPYLCAAVRWQSQYPDRLTPAVVQTLTLERSW